MYLYPSFHMQANNLSIFLRVVFLEGMLIPQKSLLPFPKNSCNKAFSIQIILFQAYLPCRSVPQVRPGFFVFQLVGVQLPVPLARQRIQTGYASQNRTGQNNPWPASAADRSEERRVGKECRSRW